MEKEEHRPAAKSAAFSLRWKVALAVSALLISVAAVIALALVSYERRFLMEEAGKRVHSLAQTLAASARDPLLIGDELRLGPLIESIMQDPDAAYALVLDHEGKVAYHPDTQLNGTPLSEWSLRTKRDQLLKAAVPIQVEGTTVGAALVALRTDFVDEAARATALGLLVRLGLGTLLGLGGILLLTELHVRRIARLESAVERLGAGDLDVQAEVRGRDELARLARGFNTMVEELRAAREEVELGITETVSALASTIEVNDSYTRGHCERVAGGTRAIAERLGVGERDVHDFQLAAVLHDIGKIGVATHILAKEGKLTDAEFKEMQQHAELGSQILGAISFLGGVAYYVRHHHEDWDGSGYPSGLMGDKIPLASRIIHVVDAYDAMTSCRPYRKALPKEEAIRRIVADRGQQFDPQIVDTFMELVQDGTLEKIRGQVDGELAA